MPVSNDNQDLKNDDKKNESVKEDKNNETKPNPAMTSDDLKGKKVDADPEKESGKPADV